MSFRDGFKYADPEKMVENFENPHFTVYDVVPEACASGSESWTNRSCGNNFPEKPHTIPDSVKQYLKGY